MAITASNTYEVREKAQKLLSKLEALGSNNTLLVDDTELRLLAQSLVDSIALVTEFAPNGGPRAGSMLIRPGLTSGYIYDHLANFKASVPGGSVIRAAPNLPAVCLSATQALVTHLENTNVLNYLDTIVTSARPIVVANGAVSGVRLASSQFVLNNATKITCPAPSGTYVNGMTPTVVNGAVTGWVMS